MIQKIKEFVKTNPIAAYVVFTLYRIMNLPKKLTLKKQFPHYSLRKTLSDEAVFFEIFQRRYYDFPVSIEPKWIIDAGANIGLTALYFSSVYPGAQIVSIEPEKENFDLMVRNTRDLDNVHPIQAGLWSETAELEIVDKGVGSFGFEVKKVPVKSETSISAITVDDICKQYQIESIDILKIDIEGSEKMLFENRPDWLDKVKVLMIELHERKMPGCTAAFESAVQGMPFQRFVNGNTIILVRTDLDLG